jgi:hypothetical protein
VTRLGPASGCSTRRRAGAPGRLARRAHSWLKPRRELCPRPNLPPDTRRSASCGAGHPPGWGLGARAGVAWAAETPGIRAASWTASARLHAGVTYRGATCG